MPFDTGDWNITHAEKNKKHTNWQTQYPCCRFPKNKKKWELFLFSTFSVQQNI